MTVWHKALQALVLVACVVAFGSPVWADLESAPFNLNPTTGLLNIPVADVLAPEQARVAGYEADIRDASDHNVLVAFSPAEDLELGLMGLQSGAWTINGQFVTSRQSEGSPFSLALGVQNLAERHVRDEDELVDPSVSDRSLYAVASRSITATTRLHLGLGTGRFDGIFGGADVLLTPDLQVMAEWDGQETNAGARWTAYRRPAGNLQVSLVGAFLDLSEPSVGVEVTFGR